MKKNINLFGKTIAVYGLNKTGVAIATSLKQRGAYIIAWDDNKNAQENASSKGIFLKNLYDEDFKNVDYLVWSPGISHTIPTPHPIATNAKIAGVEIISDIEVFMNMFPKNKYIGITGTNGKSTVTGLIHHILKTNKIETAVGANYGIPVFALPELSEKGVYVFELSSYMIELTPSLNIDCAVLTNMSPDHLDRHKNMDGYAKIKSQIFNRTDNKSHFNIIGIDDKHSAKIYEEVIKNRNTDTTIPVSIKNSIKGIYVDDDGILKDNFFEKNKKVFDLKKLTNLLGKHNWQNIAECYAVACCYKIPTEKFIIALQSFENLDHRMEKLPMPKYFENITVVNDSKGTNADSTKYALDAYKEIYWIAGGRQKTDGIEPLVKMLKPSKIIRAYMIGEATRPYHKIAKNKIDSYRCWTMKRAVNKAFKHITHDMKKGIVSHPTLLLSPSATSWDQYKSFEHRGDEFKKIVADVVAKYTKKYEKKYAKKLV
ncbi:MAG: UDP-N-acetylmuramoyl-L-alanine--D-glutamate ligase [Rickettsiales bacterium]|nr:UDP-N-acetylmuramoyl-L-alanine--D-glutamate ligase [Rickettsiales bacterium]